MLLIYNLTMYVAKTFKSQNYGTNRNLLFLHENLKKVRKLWIKTLNFSDFKINTLLRTAAHKKI